MITIIPVLTIIGLLIAGGCAKNNDTISVPTGINFAADYTSALQLAGEKNQIMVIDFYTDWCRWCNTLDSATFHDSAVIAFSQNMVFVRVNADTDTLTAQKYSIHGYPTVVVAQSDGTEIDRISGYMPPEPFMETIQNYLQDKETLADYLRRADTNATIMVNYVLGDKYSSRGMNDKAVDYFQKVIAADPDNKDSLTIDAMFSIGSILIGEKDYQKALELFDEIIVKFKGTPGAVDAVLWKGIALRNMGDTSGAIAVFRGFLKDNPDNPDSAYARSQIDKLVNPSPATGGK